MAGTEMTPSPVAVVATPSITPLHQQRSRSSLAAAAAKRPATPTTFGTDFSAISVALATIFDATNSSSISLPRCAIARCLATNTHRSSTKNQIDGADATILYAATGTTPSGATPATTRCEATPGTDSVTEGTGTNTADFST